LVGAPVPVLDAWCPPFPCLYLYFPGHRHLPPALKAFADLLRERDAQGLAPTPGSCQPLLSALPAAGRHSAITACGEAPAG